MPVTAAIGNSEIYFSVCERLRFLTQWSYLCKLVCVVQVLRFSHTSVYENCISQIEQYSLCYDPGLVQLGVTRRTAILEQVSLLKCSHAFKGAKAAYGKSILFLLPRT